jgi:hypothetical protein
MTNQEFIQKYKVDTDTLDVLTIIAANLSDLQVSLDEDSRKKLNDIKEFIFDYRKIVRKEELQKLQGEKI